MSLISRLPVQPVTVCTLARIVRRSVTVRRVTSVTSSTGCVPVLVIPSGAARPVSYVSEGWGSGGEGWGVGRGGGDEGGRGKGRECDIINIVCPGLYR